jgi:hypothetical protein
LFLSCYLMIYAFPLLINIFVALNQKETGHIFVKKRVKSSELQLSENGILAKLPIVQFYY